MNDARLRAGVAPRSCEWFDCYTCTSCARWTEVPLHFFVHQQSRCCHTQGNPDVISLSAAKVHHCHAWLHLILHNSLTDSIVSKSNVNCNLRFSLASFSLLWCNQIEKERGRDAQPHTPTHTYILTHKQTHAHTVPFSFHFFSIFAFFLINTPHPHTHPHTHTHTPTQTHTHTHTHTLTHTHTFYLLRQRPRSACHGIYDDGDAHWRSRVLEPFVAGV